jgi:hypothetical protein
VPRGITRVNAANMLDNTVVSGNIANASLNNITAIPAVIPTGALNLISTQTASSSASLEFSLDDSYDSFIFKFIDIHPATDNVTFQFNLSTDNGSNYNVTKTTTLFRTYHTEADDASALEYRTGSDLAQSTSDQKLNGNVGGDNDQCVIGTLQIFNPSSNTFVKHFIATTNVIKADDQSQQKFIAGYGNTSSPINSIIFRMSSGNFDGIIKMYGVA